MDETPQQIAAAIGALEAQRALLGDAVVEIALAPLRKELANRSAAKESDTQQLKQVSVLFVDVVGSTAIGQQLGPEEIHALMDGALERFTSVVRRHHGRVLQYTGDGMLAAFGSEEAQEDDVEGAIRAALEIIEDAKQHAPIARRQHGVPDFNVRAGIHTGTVLLGGGVDAEGSIRGATVNVAARMEQSAPAGGLRISHDTYRHVRGLFDVTEEAPISVKGVKEPLRSYLVLRPRASSFRVPNRGIEGLQTQMVGREAELRVLVDAFRTVVSERRAQAVTVVGEAGLGKSRLLAEFQQSLESTGCLVLLGRAHPRSALHAYGVLRDMFARHVGLTDATPADLARSQFVDSLSALFTTEGEAPIHLMGHLLGLDFSASPHVSELLADDDQLKRRAFEAVATCLRRLGEQFTAVVLVLDDLHWADAGSVEFMRYLRSSHRDALMLAVTLTRPVNPQFEWDEGGMDARLELRPLDTAGSKELAELLLARISDVPTALRTLLTRSAEGNPFYMEELVMMLIDDGVIVAAAEGWRVDPGKLLQARVPPTLTGVLQARIDALSRAERLALQQAAVVGHVFWDRALAAIDAAALEALPALLRKRLVVARDARTFDDSHEYAFQHHLLQQVVYDGVLKSPRLAAHARVGTFWSTRAEVSRPKDVDSARCRALAEAQYHRCKADAEAFILWFEGQFPCYLDAYATSALQPITEQLIEVCERQFGVDHPVTAKALINRARVILEMGSVDRAEPLLRRAIAIQESTLQGDHLDKALGYAVLGGYYSGRGDLVAAEPLYRRALGIRQRALGSEHPLTLNCLDYLAKATLELGRLDEAETLSRQVLDARRLQFGGHHEDTAFAMTALGEVLSKQGKYEQAESLIREALAIQRETLAADHPDTGLSMWHLSEALRRTERCDEAELLARRTLQIWETTFGADHEWTAWGLISLAETRLAQGEPAEAAALAGRAVKIVEDVYGPRHAVLESTLSLQARALVAAGEHLAAAPVLKRAQLIRGAAVGGAVSGGTGSPGQGEVAPHV